jgi:acyl-CoA synthetase (NDP forming)
MQNDLHAHISLRQVIELRPLFHPRSIAIVGASAREGSFGSRILANLAAFDGPLYLVNERYRNIGGHRCFASLADLPDRPDCVLIVVPQAAVETVVRQCVECGIGGVVLYASGYAETGKPKDTAAQSRLIEIVRGTGTRLLGPNSLGLVNYHAKARMTFGRVPAVRPLGAFNLGIVTQSGALGMALSQAMERGVSIGHVIMTGNAGDVDLADSVNYLVEEPACAAIICVFEGTQHPGRLIAAAERARDANKPLIVYKMASGTQGAAAAMSHTGVVSGSHDAYIATFERAGAVMVDSLDDVLETALFFAKAGRPKAEAVAVIVTSGGAGVMAADKAEAHAIDLRQPDGSTLERLREVLPDFATPRNPCDVTAQVMSDPTLFPICLEAFMGDARFGAIVSAVCYADEFSARLTPLNNALARKHGKIFCAYWATEWLEAPGAAEIDEQSNMALFRSLDRCMRTLRKWHDREQEERLRAVPAHRPNVPTAAVAEALASVGTGLIAEREAKALLARYRVPVVDELLARDEEEAVQAAVRLGWPVVLKVESVAIPHKTEAGVVALDVRTEDDLRKRFRTILANARKVVTSESDIAGVLVQPMISCGVELLLGGRIEPGLGPVIVVGFGGMLVEVLDDAVTALAPVSPQQALRMLQKLKGYRLLQDFRGSGAVDLDQLCEVIAAVSQFLSDHAKVVLELDVNPLICSPERIVAVDALIKLGKTEMS